MEKIIRKALEGATFKIEDVLKVINATENPAIATEVLLGIYEPPTIKLTSDKLDIYYYKPQLVSYNPISDRVTFDYERVVTKTCWFKMNEDYHNVDTAVVVGAWDAETAWKTFRENHKSTISFDDFKKCYERKEIITEFTGDTRVDTCSLRNWQ